MDCTELITALMLSTKPESTDASIFWNEPCSAMASKSLLRGSPPNIRFSGGTPVQSNVGKAIESA